MFCCIRILSKKLSLQIRVTLRALLQWFRLLWLLDICIWDPKQYSHSISLWTLRISSLLLLLLADGVYQSFASKRAVAVLKRCQTRFSLFPKSDTYNRVKFFFVFFFVSSSGKNHRPFCGWLEVFARDKEARVQTSKKARDAVQERQERSKRREDVENCRKNASVRLGVTGESESSEARSLRVTQANILENFRRKRGVDGREIFRAPNVSVRV